MCVERTKDKTFRATGPLESVLILYTFEAAQLWIRERVSCASPSMSVVIQNSGSDECNCCAVQGQASPQSDHEALQLEPAAVNALTQRETLGYQG